VIISASRRTDIPCFYSEWLINRVREGFVYVRNPMNYHQVSEISLSPEMIDGIVFWTKNPIPMMDKLYAFSEYAYYFQFTLTSYGKDIEGNVPSKNDVIVPEFQSLSKKIGRERVIWRYDPILITKKYTKEYHIEYFEALAKRLSGYTEKCVISFVDLYRNTQAHMNPNKILPLSKDDMLCMAKCISDIGQKYKIRIESCAEEIDLEMAGIRHGACIDKNLFERLLGCPLDSKKDKNQRTECGCMESVDIGLYDTCRNGCLYCYADHSKKTLQKNIALYDPESPFLCGSAEEGDKITKRAIKSFKTQNTLTFL